ncbi:hypothetical protein M3Y97_00331900 [Aphelenchoides bicaudatus]|nr:hypothetical protein M3Y97_00331900 [Aphelenchoides bicaudatus]
MASVKLAVLAFAAVLFVAKFEVQAAGGVAELKALTGDAPYMGFGNQEQAPEYFGDALYRQAYTNPSYGYVPPNPYSNYNMRYGGAASYYRMPYYQVGGGFGDGLQAVAQPAQPVSAYQSQAVAQAVAQPSVGASNGFYQGSGNDWVKKTRK